MTCGINVTVCLILFMGTCKATQLIILSICKVSHVLLQSGTYEQPDMFRSHKLHVHVHAIKVIFRQLYDKCTDSA